MTWLESLTHLTETRTPFVMVTVAKVRGHAPRDAGAKMLVTKSKVYGSVGGGNLEQVAIDKARQLLTAGEPATELLTLTLNPKGGNWGVQCCGGEVTLLLETVNPAKPTVAIFGAGHVGTALAKVLSILPINIQLIDSREKQLNNLQFSNNLQSVTSNLQLIHAPVPEAILETLPAGSHLLIMTHDHAEDIAILDVALTRGGWRYIGLIGSSAKWAHFQQELKEQGHTEEALTKVTTPIGLPAIKSKRPEVIAVSVAAQLLERLGLE